MIRIGRFILWRSAITDPTLCPSVCSECSVVFISESSMHHRTSNLPTRFTTWCLHHGASESSAADLWTQLSALYTETHRHYHHLGHIASSLAEFDATGSNKSLIEGAIWFHDVIYDPKRGDNEVASIAWFLDATSSWLDPQSATVITRLIEATDFRLPPSDDPDSSLMVDIDLAILSASPEAYADYCQAIRQEYAHVSDEAFREGRAQVMAGFLERPIYRTEWFIEREERARENIVRELGRLGGGGPD